MLSQSIASRKRRRRARRFALLRGNGVGDDRPLYSPRSTVAYARTPTRTIIPARVCARTCTSSDFERRALDSSLGGVTNRRSLFPFVLILGSRSKRARKMLPRREGEKYDDDDEAKNSLRRSRHSSSSSSLEANEKGR